MARNALVIFVMLVLSGCAQYVGTRIVQPGSIYTVQAGDETAKQLLDTITHAEFEFNLDAGDRVMVTVIGPANREFSTRRLAASESIDGVAEAPKSLVQMVARFEQRGRVGRNYTRFYAKPADPAIDPVGTVILLHGMGMDRWQMMPWALQFADQGWRSVLVDLRGHGYDRSQRTWGAKEPRDLTLILDDLILRELVDNRVVAVGSSYGGAIAIQWAAKDERIQAVVTLGAFANAGDVIRESARAQFAGGWLVPDWLLDRGIARAGEILAHDLDDGLSPERAVARVEVPLLFIHGTDDRTVRPTHAHRLHAAAPNSTLWMRKGADHLDPHIDQGDLFPVVLCWLRNLDDAGHDLDCVPGDADAIAVEGAP